MAIQKLDPFQLGATRKETLSNVSAAALAANTAFTQFQTDLAKEHNIQGGQVVVRSQKIDLARKLGLADPTGPAGDLVKAADEFIDREFQAQSGLSFNPFGRTNFGVESELLKQAGSDITDFLALEQAANQETSQGFETETQRAAKREAAGITFGQQPQQQGRLLGPTEFSQLQGQGLTEEDITRVGQDIFLKPESSFEQQPAGTPEIDTGLQAASTVTPEEQVNTLIQQADQQGAEGISNLLLSGKTFNEVDAKNFAFFKGDQNFQKFIGGVAGQPNPNYIGPTAFDELQRKYTSHQIEQATIRTKDGIYWNPEVNIADIPSRNPEDAINDDTIVISDLITKAKDQADPFISDKVKDAEAKEAEEKSKLDITDTKNKEVTIADLTDNNNFSFTQAEDLYNELFKTNEIKNAQSDVSKLQSELDEFDQQIEELKNDIRREVEGEASESAITALATIRGEQILKQKRSKQRDFDTALSQLNNLKDSAQNILNLRIQDKNERFDRLTKALDLQFKQAGFELDQETQRLNNSIATLNAAMSIPAGKSVQLPDGSIIQGINDDSDINVVDFTNANNEVFRIGIDSQTGEIKFNTFIGTGQPKFKPTTKVGNGVTAFKFSTSRINDGIAVGFTTQDLNNIQTSINNGNSMVDIIAANPNLSESQEKFLRGQSLTQIGKEEPEVLDVSTLSDEFITNAIDTATTQLGDAEGNIIGEEIDVNKLPGKTPAEKDALLQEAFDRGIKERASIDQEDEESLSFFERLSRGLSAARAR
jgi:hypothetical protein